MYRPFLFFIQTMRMRTIFKVIISEAEMLINRISEFGSITNSNFKLNIGISKHNWKSQVSEYEDGININSITKKSLC